MNNETLRFTKQLAIFILCNRKLFSVFSVSNLFSVFRFFKKSEKTENLESFEPCFLQQIGPFLGQNYSFLISGQVICEKEEDFLE